MVLREEREARAGNVADEDQSLTRRTGWLPESIMKHVTRYFGHGQNFWTWSVLDLLFLFCNGAELSKTWTDAGLYFISQHYTQSYLLIYRHLAWSAARPRTLYLTED